MSHIKSLVLSLRDRIAIAFIYLVLFWTIFALGIQMTMLFLDMSGNTKIAGGISSWFVHKFDGLYKNHPENIMYQEEDHIWVEGVENQVKIGKLAGNRNLAFGVKNILEEYLQEKGYDLSQNAAYKLKVNIVYLDVLSTKTNIGVFHKGEEEVVVRLQGILYKDGKKEKEVVVEEGSSEISMSTLIVDQGGSFNQTSLSNALKKASDKLVTKLFGKNAK